MSELEYIQQIRQLILSQINTDHYAVFLFGGRADGHKGKGVDVDVGILGVRALPLKELSLLYEKIEESSIPLKIDIVDFYDVDDVFKKIALQKIEIWNQPATIKIN